MAAKQFDGRQLREFRNICARVGSAEHPIATARKTWPLRKTVASTLLVGVSAAVSADSTVVVGIGGATAAGKSQNQLVEIKTADGHSVTIRVPQPGYSDCRQALDVAGAKSATQSDAHRRSNRLGQT